MKAFGLGIGELEIMTAEETEEIHAVVPITEVPDVLSWKRSVRHGAGHR